MTKHSRSGSRKSKKSSVSKSRTRGVKSGDKVLVEWEDAYSENSWSRDPYQHEAAIVENLGHVIFHDKRGIMLAASRMIDGVAGSRFFIPKGMIRKVKVLKGV